MGAPLGIMSSPGLTPSSRTAAGPAGGGGGSGVHHNAQQTFVSSLRKGSGTGGNPNMSAQKSQAGSESRGGAKTPRGTSSKKPERNPEHEVPPPGFHHAQYEDFRDEFDDRMDFGGAERPPFAYPARLRARYMDDFDYDYDYVHAGRTAPDVLNPYTGEFDGGYGNFYESGYFYDRGVGFEDLPRRMPSARDLHTMPRGPDGAPLATTRPERIQYIAPGRPEAYVPPRIDQHTHYHQRALREDISLAELERARQETYGIRPHTKADTARHRGGWKSHWTEDDDHHHWKGYVPGKDIYRAHPKAPPASRDHRLRNSTVHDGSCNDSHGSPARSMFSGKHVAHLTR